MERKKEEEEVLVEEGVEEGVFGNKNLIKKKRKMKKKKKEKEKE